MKVSTCLSLIQAMLMGVLTGVAFPKDAGVSFVIILIFTGLTVGYGIAVQNEMG